MPGAGVDEPLVWYAGPGTAGRQWLHADPHGSIIAWSNATGALIGSQGYGPWGEPASWTAGSRYAYTGQIMIPQAQLYDFKARMYDPTLGRFLQSDPIGQASDVNPYAYVGNDPVNGWDPSGMAEGYCPQIGGTAEACWGYAPPESNSSGFSGAFGGFGGGAGLGSGEGSGGKNGVGQGGAPAPQKPQRPPRPPTFTCHPATTPLGRLADAADTVSASADVTALVAGGAALLTSETLVGGVTFASVAQNFESLSQASGVTSVLANLGSGRYGNAGVGIVGLALGLGSGPMKLVPPVVNYLHKIGINGVAYAVASLC